MVYVFLAPGFEEIEALTPVDILRRAGIEVRTVGVGAEIVEGVHGIPVKADMSVDEIKLNSELEMIVLPGGMPGADNLENSPEVLAAVDYCADNNKYVAAICAAPKILGHKRLLEGRYAICFPGFEQELLGANLSDRTVTIDGKYITGKSAGVALKFALKLVEALISKEKASMLEASLKCR